MEALVETIKKRRAMRKYSWTDAHQKLMDMGYLYCDDGTVVPWSPLEEKIGSLGLEKLSLKK